MFWNNRLIYFRGRSLIAAGLVRRKGGNYTLTSLGTIVDEKQLIIQKAVSTYWKLTAIVGIESSGVVGEQERTKLIKTIVNEDTDRITTKSRNIQFPTLGWIFNICVKF